MRLTSSISGMFSNVTSSSNNTEAGKALSAAFLAPRTSISPCKVFSPARPSITNLLCAMGVLFFLRMFFRVDLPPELFGKVVCLVAHAL